MTTIHFLLKHIPFWVIPLMMISGEFAYIYWLRDRKKVANIFLLLCTICVGLLVYYFISGGPKGSVHSFIMFWNEGGDFGKDLMKQ